MPLSVLCGLSDLRGQRTGNHVTIAPVAMNVRLHAAAFPVLAGDDSVEAASRLERVVLDDYPDDERLDDLLEVLALYVPSQPPPHTGQDQLRQRPPCWQPPTRAGTTLPSPMRCSTPGS